MALKDMNANSNTEASFFDGVTASDVDFTLASNVFNTLLHFANYDFNKSHAVAYSILAFITMYLKVSFPLDLCRQHDS